MMSSAVITNYTSVLNCSMQDVLKQIWQLDDITDLIKMQVNDNGFNGHLNKNNLPEQELCKQVELTCLIANFII